MALARSTRKRSPPATLVFGKALTHLLLLMPLFLLGWRAWQEQTLANGALGADPIAEIERTLGIWALRILCLALAITPLSQLFRSATILRYRRLVGLYAFTYASAHLLTYLVLDLQAYWLSIGQEIIKRPYITVGFSAWLILLALALTSPIAMVRRLGSHWRRLHRWVYVAAVLAVLHFWWLVKSDVREPALYAAIIAGLLGIRLYWAILARTESRR